MSEEVTIVIEESADININVIEHDNCTFEVKCLSFALVMSIVTIILLIIQKW